jgi:hypothetical protein
VQTGKGLHLYVARSGLGNRAGVIPGVDYRGEGGYVVALPSVHVSGRVYSWSTHGPATTGLVVPPRWMRSILRPAPAQERTTQALPPLRNDQRKERYGRNALLDECEKVETAPAGGRNHALNRSAFRVGQLVIEGVVPVDDAVGQLLSAAARAGLGEHESEATVRSGLDRANS